MDRTRPPLEVSARRAALGFGALAATTFALIVLGALVRANGAGLSCPDWPLCFGQVVPTFDFRIALEWGHRLLASIVSFGLLAATLSVWRIPELRSRVRGILIFAWVILVVQVVLGGLTVLLGLAPWTVTAHLLVGNTFCASLLWVALELRDAGESAPAPAMGPVTRFLVFAAAVLVVAQMALGGLVSSHYAGLACSAFPTCDGTHIAPTFSGLIGIHVIHRLNAFAALLAFVALVFTTAGTRSRAGDFARHGLRLILLQIAVGVANVLLRLPVEVTALHSALAAAIVLLTVSMVREAVRAGASDAAHGAENQPLGATS